MLLKLLTVLLLAKSSVATPMYGLDILGIQHPKINCDIIVDNWPNNFGLGILYNTFVLKPNSLKCAKRVLEKASFLRAHGFNGSGLRRQKLERNEPHFGYTIKSFQASILNGEPRFITKNQEMARLTEKLSQLAGIPCFYSPIIEHNLINRAIRILLDDAKKAAPTCTIINNPENSNAKGRRIKKGELLELHGSKVKLKAPCAISQDGEDGYEINARRWNRRYAPCVLRFLWTFRFNLRTDTEFSYPSTRSDGPNARDIGDLSRRYINSCGELDICKRDIASFPKDSETKEIKNTSKSSETIEGNVYSTILHCRSKERKICEKSTRSDIKLVHSEPRSKRLSEGRLLKAEAEKGIG